MRTIPFVTALAILLAFSVATAAAGTLRFQTCFHLRDRIDACPPEYPAATTACCYVTSTTLVKGLGRVTVTQRSIIDQLGGYRVKASGTFAAPGLGEILFAGDNSAYPGSNKFDFTFSGGTGRLAGATGGGTVINSLTQSPTAFWEASLVAPTDDVRPCGSVVHPHEPHGEPGSGRKLRLRIGYSVRDASRPVSLRAVVGEDDGQCESVADGHAYAPRPRSAGRHAHHREPDRYRRRRQLAYALFAVRIWRIPLLRDDPSFEGVTRTRDCAPRTGDYNG